MSMRPPWVLLVPVLGLLLAACDHTTSSSTHAEPACCPNVFTAHVVGTLVGIGGPTKATTQHWAGVVHVARSQLTTIKTDERGRFAADLAPGTYHFTATSPLYDGGHGTCQTEHPVRLRAHHTTHVRVVCQLK